MEIAIIKNVPDRMTVAERLAIIERKSAEQKEKAKAAETSIKDQTERAMLKVKELAPRIQALLTIANKCVEEQVDFPARTDKYGYGSGYRSHNFLADGIYHHVGFMDCHKAYAHRNEPIYNKIEYIGIDEGGFCGVWDFYTNGNETFLRHESKDLRKPAELKYLNDFLNEFDTFERAFYNWVDSMA